jgi:hypothetical protein
MIGVCFKTIFEATLKKKRWFSKLLEVLSDSIIIIVGIDVWSE